jgi:lysozyme family protein
MNSLKLALHNVSQATGVLAETRLSPKSASVFAIQPTELSYELMYQGAQITQANLGAILFCTKKILDGKSEYQLVEQKTGVPWYFVGCLHGLESSFDFKTYLHNGDPLGKRTTHVPKGILFGKDDWHGAAIDALKRQALTMRTDWSLGKMLTRAEKFNGLGYLKKGINSPYLWSKTSLYTKGKYVRDGVWDKNAVSAQVGVAAMLLVLERGGHVTIPRAGSRLA